MPARRKLIILGAGIAVLFLMFNNQSSAQNGPPPTEVVEQAMRATLPNADCVRTYQQSGCRQSGFGTITFVPPANGPARLEIYFIDTPQEANLTAAAQLLHKFGFTALEVDNCRSRGATADVRRGLPEVRGRSATLTCGPVTYTVVWQSF